MHIEIEMPLNNETCQFKMWRVNEGHGTHDNLHSKVQYNSMNMNNSRYPDMIQHSNTRSALTLGMPQTD
jgi:hypothetical protein